MDRTDKASTRIRWPFVKLQLPRLRSFQIHWPRRSPPKLLMAIGGGIGVTAVIGALMLYYAFGFQAWASLPDPGIYDLPGILVTERDDSTQTLNLGLSGSRINTLDITAVNVGKASGLTTVLEVGANSGQFLEVETVLIDGLVCESLTVGNSEISNLVLTNNQADGNSFSQVIGTPSAVTITSTRGMSVIPQITGSTYDHITIDSGVAGATMKSLILTGIDTFGGTCVIDDIKAGTLTITNGTFGSGSGIDTADFTILSTVTVETFTDTSNVETPINVK